MGEGILPIMPQALASMLDVTTCQIHDLKEFVPLINQIIDKFKAKVRSESSNLAEKAIDQNRRDLFLGGFFLARPGRQPAFWVYHLLVRASCSRWAFLPSTNDFYFSDSYDSGFAVIFFRWNPC